MPIYISLSNHTLFSKISILTPIRLHLAELLYQYQSGFIRQSFALMLTRPYQAKLLHQYQPGLIKQNFYINTNQASSDLGNQALSGKTLRQC